MIIYSMANLYQLSDVICLFRDMELISVRFAILAQNNNKCQ
jgi:hypothetical protein